jgi:hypothetical protein
MDHLERAEVLLAQLEILLSGGRLEAAAKLAGEVRQQLRIDDLSVPDLEILDDDDRSSILGPLSELLRTQRALGRDIQHEAARRRGKTDEKEGPGAARVRLAAAVKEVSRALARFARSRLDQPDLSLEAATRLRDLTVGVNSLDLPAARAAVVSLRGLISRPLPLGPLSGPPTPDGPVPTPEALLSLLDSLDRELHPETDLGSVADLAGRQRALLARLQPLLEQAEVNPSAVHDTVRQATDSMGAATSSLTAASLIQADAHARGAAAALTETLRQVDAALTSGTFQTAAPPGFLSKFSGGALAEWDLPPALGLHLHERVQRAGPEGDLRRDLAALVRRLIEPNPKDVTVSINHMGGDDPIHRRVDVGVFLAGRGAQGTRYRVRLSFSADHGVLAPSRWGAQGALPTFGGAADVLFTTDLAECEVTVLRLRDRGQGPPAGYVDVDVDPSLRNLLHQRLPTEFRIGPVGQSPVQAEVLSFLQSLLSTADESPLSEAQLKALGVPWYDVADLVDRLRPVQERLQYQLLDAVNEDGFLGLVWAGELGHSFCMLTHSVDGRAPVVALRRSLLDWLAWAARSGVSGAAVSPKDLLVALQLNLGLKLTFYDALTSDVGRQSVRSAARALEGAWLRSRGLSPTALRDLLTRLETSFRADVEAQADGDMMQRWRRTAENLVDARAGEQLLKGSKLPASVLFSSLRGILAHDLRRQGLVAAARATDQLGAFEDAAVLFANLVVEPETGDGVLIVGDSKLGKSSITARLVAGDGQNPGWRFGASDRVLLLVPPRKRGGEPPPALAIASPAHMSFGNFTQEHWYRDEHGREIRPRDHAPSKDLAPIRLVVFMRRDGADLRGSTLSAEAVGDLVRDFQARFGFPASRRFWKALFASSAVLDVPLSYRGPDTFLEAAANIRRELANASMNQGAAEVRTVALTAEGAWFEVADERVRIRITRVDRDGIDVDWFLLPDGSATVRPAHIRQEVEVRRPGSYDVTRLGSRIPLDRGRIEQISGQPMFRVTSTRWMPLTPPYFVVESNQPFFLVPDLPGQVVNTAYDVLERADQRRFRNWAGDL